MKVGSTSGDTAADHHVNQIFGSKVVLCIVERHTLFYTTTNQVNILGTLEPLKIWLSLRVCSKIKNIFYYIFFYFCKMTTPD